MLYPIRPETANSNHERIIAIGALIRDLSIHLFVTDPRALRRREIGVLFPPGPLTGGNTRTSVRGPEARESARGRAL